jgi:Ca-activated chloride channel homolog
VDEVVALAQVIRAQLEAEARGRRGEFREAQTVMHELHLSLRARGRHAAATVCERVMATVADRAAYDDSASFRTSMKAGVTRGARGSFRVACCGQR